MRIRQHGREWISVLVRLLSVPLGRWAASHKVDRPIFIGVAVVESEVGPQMAQLEPKTNNPNINQLNSHLFASVALAC